MNRNKRLVWLVREKCEVMKGMNCSTITKETKPIAGRRLFRRECAYIKAEEFVDNCIFEVPSTCSP